MEEIILIQLIPAVPPLSEWEALFANADTSLEPEFADWDISLMDGLD